MADVASCATICRLRGSTRPIRAAEHIRAGAVMHKRKRKAEEDDHESDDESDDALKVRSDPRRSKIMRTSGSDTTTDGTCPRMLNA